MFYVLLLKDTLLNLLLFFINIELMVNNTKFIPGWSLPQRCFLHFAYHFLLVLRNIRQQLCSEKIHQQKAQRYEKYRTDYTIQELREEGRVLSCSGFSGDV